jgi:hypothetical protein
VTPEAQILLMIAGAMFGSAGVTAALSYWVRARADTNKIIAEGLKDARVKALEIKLEDALTKREKSKSDERQTDKLIASNNQLLFMLSKTIDDLHQTRELYETNYKVLQSIYDRSNQELRGILQGLDLKFSKVVADMRPAFQSDLTDAMLRNQTMTATADLMTTYHLGVRFPHDNDKRWQRCVLKFSHTDKIIVHKIPTLADDNAVGYIYPNDKVWIIPEVYSQFPEFGIVMSDNMPEARGYILMHNLVMDDCNVLIKANGSSGKVA